MLRWVAPDGRRLLLARVLRTFAYGYLSVVLGVYLDRLGLDPARIGVVLTSAIAGSAAMTVLWSLFADRYGRRRTISTMAVLMTVGGLAFALTDSFAVLILAGFTGTISATNSEVGVFHVAYGTAPAPGPVLAMRVLRSAAERRSKLTAGARCPLVVPCASMSRSVLPR